jgi:Ca2+/Na+ antiporter
LAVCATEARRQGGFFVSGIFAGGLMSFDRAIVVLLGAVLVFIVGAFALSGQAPPLVLAATAVLFVLAIAFGTRKSK